MLSISSQRYLNTLGSLGICGLFGSGSLGARGRVLGLPAGGGWRRCHSAPLENRTLCFVPLPTTAMTTTATTATTAKTTSAKTVTTTQTAKTTSALPLRPGDGEHPSFPPPAGSTRWPGKATLHFSYCAVRGPPHLLTGVLNVHCGVK